MAVEMIEACVADTRAWATPNIKLKINNSKTYIVYLNSRFRSKVVANVDSV